MNRFEDAVKAMETSLDIPVASPEACTSALKTISEAISHKVVELNEDTFKACSLLLADAGFQQALLRKNEFQLQDCWMSFAEHLQSWPNWGGPKWLPSIDDCVACRVRTTGIQEEEFKIDSVVFKVVDVGGQRAERRKWIHCFDNVTALIFTAAISEYDQVLFEDRKKNRLEEALDLFEEVCAMKVFQSIDMILFLNKKDLFEKKFVQQGIPLDAIKFPGAPVPHDGKACLAFIEKLFLARNSKKKKIYVHITVATDPDNIKKVFDACKNIILVSSMSASGFKD